MIRVIHKNFTDLIRIKDAWFSNAAGRRYVTANESDWINEIVFSLELNSGVKIFFPSEVLRQNFEKLWPYFEIKF